jgi:hypothetical protein
MDELYEIDMRQLSAFAALPQNLEKLLQIYFFVLPCRERRIE